LFYPDRRGEFCQHWSLHWPEFGQCPGARLADTKACRSIMRAVTFLGPTVSRHLAIDSKNHFSSGLGCLRHLALKASQLSQTTPVTCKTYSFSSLLIRRLLSSFSLSCLSPSTLAIPICLCYSCSLSFLIRCSLGLFRCPFGASTSSTAAYHRFYHLYHSTAFLLSSHCGTNSSHSINNENQK
jgi:hypothetical protein